MGVRLSAMKAKITETNLEWDGEVVDFAYKPNEFGQRNVTYGGALIVMRLRSKIGKTAFDATTRSWPQDNLDSSRGRARYVEYLEEKTGKTLGPWFSDWLTSTTTPSA